MTVDLNIEMYRALAQIAGDETLMKQAVDFVKSLIKRKKEADHTLMTKEEYFAKIDRSLEQAKRGEVKTVKNKQELEEYFNSL
ncbi:MAG: hypothetical protein II937_02030 [Bacteroidales bacterium]|nr:hypothetical protein [Bacteroidales bacterium]